jgi:hypothetical protein
MTRASQIAALLAAQRERDQLRVVNSKLRDKLLELAKECASCGGTGVVTVMVTTAWDDDGRPCERVEPCGDCESIREALA